MKNTVTFIQNNYMYFNVSAEDACSVGPPRWHPPTPVKPEKPTPTPQPSPNPIDFACNETHYIYSDLNQIYQDVYNGTVKLSYPGATVATLSRWDVWYHPWKQIPCPSYPEQAYCFDFPDANIWGCWHEDSGRYVCFPVADVDYGNDARPRGTTLDQGLELVYGGAWGYNCEVNVKCVPGEERTQITFDDVTTSSWMNTNGIKVIFDTDSEYVCPIEFTASDRMPRSPTPTPEPSKYNGPLYFESTMVNFTYASIDLRLLQPVVQQRVYVGYRKNLVKMNISYSPVEKVDCPDGMKCLGGAKSNIWYCGDYSVPNTDPETLCVPGGDIDAGLVVDNFDDENPMGGILFNYDGGFGNDTETQVFFQCNDSVPEHTIVFEPVVFRPPPSGRHSVYFARAHTSDVCPVTLGRKKVTGGAIFLLILILAGIIYFSGLVLFFFIKDGQATIPNEGFWIEVGLSIVGIFQGLFKGKQSYDSI